MPNGKHDRMTTTIDVDKSLFLRFKALCVLNEQTISGEIEHLIKKRVGEMSRKAGLS